MTPIEVLTKCFRALPKVQRDRLLRHERKKTPICCGKRANAFRIGKAG